MKRVIGLSALLASALSVATALEAFAQADQLTPGAGGGNTSCAPGSPGCDVQGPPTPQVSCQYYGTGCGQAANPAPTQPGNAFDQANALQGGKPGVWQDIGNGMWSQCTDTMCSMPCQQGPSCGPGSSANTDASQTMQAQSKPAAKDPGSDAQGTNAGDTTKTGADGGTTQDVQGSAMSNDPSGSGSGSGPGIPLTAYTPPPSTYDSLTAPDAGAGDPNADDGTVSAGKRAPEVLAALRNVDNGFSTSAAPSSGAGPAGSASLFDNVLAALGLAKRTGEAAVAQAGGGRADAAAADAGVAFQGNASGRPETPVHETRGAFGTNVVTTGGSDAN